MTQFSISNSVYHPFELKINLEVWFKIQKILVQQLLHNLQYDFEKVKKTTFLNQKMLKMTFAESQNSTKQDVRYHLSKFRNENTPSSPFESESNT